MELQTFTFFFLAFVVLTGDRVTESQSDRVQINDAMMIDDRVLINDAMMIGDEVLMNDIVT